MNLPPYLIVGDRRYNLDQGSIQLYQMGDDYQVLGGVRGCAYGGCPGVMVLQDSPDTFFDLDWQMYLIGCNPGMTLNAVSSLMGGQKALMNEKGVGDPGFKRNYILSEDLTAELPRLDKLRTFGLNTHSGTDDGTYLYIQTMDGNNPPPMKPGKPRPRSIAEIVPDDYLYLPWTHRHLFLDCNNVKWKPETSSLDYGPFASGSVRDWIGDGRPHSFFPLVSRFSIVSPMRFWKKLPPGSPFPSPFRSG